MAIKLPKNHFAYYLSVARPFTPAEVAGVRAKCGLPGDHAELPRSFRHCLKSGQPPASNPGNPLPQNEATKNTNCGTAVTATPQLPTMPH